MNNSNDSSKKKTFTSDELLEKVRLSFRNFLCIKNLSSTSENYHYHNHEVAIKEINPTNDAINSVFLFTLNDELVQGNKEFNVRIESKTLTPEKTSIFFKSNIFFRFDYHLLHHKDIEAIDLYLGGEEVNSKDLKCTKNPTPFDDYPYELVAERLYPMDLNKNPVNIDWNNDANQDYVSLKNLKLLYLNNIRKSIAKNLTDDSYHYQLQKTEERAYGYMWQILESDLEKNKEKLKDLQKKYSHITELDPYRLEKHFDHLDAEKKNQYDGLNANQFYVDILLMMTLTMESSRPNFFTMNHYFEMFNIDMSTLRALEHIKAGKRYIQD